MQVIEIVPDKAFKQTHEVGDFFDGPVPVLHGKAVHRQIVEPEVDRRAHGFAKRFLLPPVTFDPRQPPPCGPASVAIHDHADMHRRTRQALLRGRCRLVLNHG